MQVLLILSSCVFFALHLMVSLLRDALRFASLGLLHEKIRQRIREGDRREQHLSRMEQYFYQEGRNLRELEWAATLMLTAFMLLYLFAILELGWVKNQSGIDGWGFDGLFYLLASAFICIFIVNEFLSRMFSEPFAESILDRLYLLWRILHGLFFPLTWTLHHFQIFVQRVGGVSIAQETEKENEQKMLDSMVDGERHGVLDNSEREMIENIMEFRDAEVSKVMTPRTDMIAASVDSSAAEIIGLMQEKNLSRILLFEENRDHVVGYVHTRDFLPYWSNPAQAPPLKELVRETSFVPETKKIRSLLQEFMEKHLHIAVVLDEYGGTEGLVTMEDLLEEIVGDIVDEHQSEEDNQHFQLLDANSARVKSRIRIDELNELFKLDLEESENYDSLGGLLIEKLGRIPVSGEQGKLDGSNLLFKVLQADPRRIEEVLLTKVSSEDRG